MVKFTKEYIEQIVRGIYDGTITEHELPVSLYEDIADSLKKALYDGYGINYEELLKKVDEGIGAYTENDVKLLDDLRDNVYMFSAAKVFQQTKQMSEALIDEDGAIRPWNEFKQMAEDIFDTYNKDYLQSEYVTAQTAAQTAAKYSRAESEAHVLPCLEYSTIGDACEICAPLNGLVAPVDDAIWSTIAPPNHFNCRCLVMQVDEPKSPGADSLVSEVSEKMDAEFKQNPGKSGEAFPSDHPYFTVPKGDQAFAEKNFNLKIPKHD